MAKKRLKYVSVVTLNTCCCDVP